MKTQVGAILSFIMIAVSAKAAIFDCKISENLQVVEKYKVDIGENTRVKVSRGPSFDFYVSSKKKGIIELEAFLPAVEMRIYALGNTTKEPVVLTSWQRDGLLEFSCSAEYF